MLKIFIYILFMVVVPYLVGTLISKYLSGNTDSVALSLVCGYSIIFATTEILVLVGFILDLSLTILTILCLNLWLAMAICSVFFNKGRLVRILKNCFNNFVKCGFLAFLVTIIIFAQTVFVTTFQHIDDDDAYYVATTETALSTDSIMKYDPYTGNEYKKPPARYLLSPFPIYQAVIAKFTGITPVILAHTMFPAIMIPLGYIVYWLLSVWIWSEEEENSQKKRCTFLILSAFVLLYSGYSVYTQGMFFLIRIWQGKAVLAGILLPLVLYWCLCMQKNSLTKADWLMMGIIMTANCLVSSMGIMLSTILVGSVTVIEFIHCFRWRWLFTMVCCCIPNIILSVVYLIIR